MPEATAYVIKPDAGRRERCVALLREEGYLSAGYSSVQEFLSGACCETEGCVVLDAISDFYDAIHLQQELRKRGSDLEVVAVVAKTDVMSAVELMLTGAAMVVESPVPQGTLLAAVRVAVDCSRERTVRARSLQSFRTGLAELTAEERSVMDGMIAGRPIKAVARDLDVSMRTIERKRRAVLTKLRVNSVGRLGMLLAQCEFFDRQNRPSLLSVSAAS